MKGFMIPLAGLLLATAAHAENKMGFVDMQRAIQTTDAGKKARTELENEFNKRKKEFEKQETDLKKLSEDFEKRKSLLTDEALQKKQSEFQDEVAHYRDAVAKSQVDLQKKQQDLTAPIVEKMKKAIDKVAKDKGFTVVLEKNQDVLFAAADSDITNEVIKAYENQK